MLCRLSKIYSNCLTSVLVNGSPAAETERYFDNCYNINVQSIHISSETGWEIVV